MNRRVVLVFALLSLAASRPNPAVSPATLVLRGGKIVTVDAARPEVQAMAIRGDRIAALGTNEEIQAYVGPSTKVIDLGGQTAIPGLIEGHGHFAGMSRARMSLKLAGARNFEEVVAMVAEAVKHTRPGDWIEGRGWHQEKWAHRPSPNVEGFPQHDALSRVSPDNPVILTHASGHAVFANAKACNSPSIASATAPTAKC